MNNVTELPKKPEPEDVIDAFRRLVKAHAHEKNPEDIEIAIPLQLVNATLQQLQLLFDTITPPKEGSTIKCNLAYQPGNIMLVFNRYVKEFPMSAGEARKFAKQLGKAANSADPAKIQIVGSIPSDFNKDPHD